MDPRVNALLFPLLRCAVCATALREEERKLFSRELSADLLKTADKHDVAHLLALGLKQSGLVGPEEESGLENIIFKAVYRYECLNAEYEQLCRELETAKLPFIPLKGSVLRRYYPEAWMRTSCDIDLLLPREKVGEAVSYLVKNLEHTETWRSSHDISLFSPTGEHVELHFDLLEEGYANDAIGVLSDVWSNVTLCEGSEYRYEMNDAFFYFYHVAHMAKHFETGGCGIRPLLDLWILDRMEGRDFARRDELLAKVGLLKFAEVSRKLSRVWFDGEEADELSVKMQEFILHGGVYGSTDNRVALQQKKKGGRFGFFMSRVFIPYEKLKRYYPILEKHRWLTPIMQIRRWFMLLNPDLAKMAQREIKFNSKIDKSKAEEMNAFLKGIGLQ